MNDYVELWCQALLGRTLRERWEARVLVLSLHAAVCLIVMWSVIAIGFAMRVLR